MNNVRQASIDRVAVLQDGHAPIPGAKPSVISFWYSQVDFDLGFTIPDGLSENYGQFS